MPHTMVKACNFGLRILLLGLLLAGVFFTNPPTAVQASDTGQWTVTISGLDGTVCVGDPYMLTAHWNPSPDGVLSPLTGPKAIIVKAKNGFFDHETERPATASGTALFAYTAKNSGEETVTIQLFNYDLEVDSSFSTQFEVKKCDYMYTLIARSDFSATGGVISFYSIMKSKGLLTAPDPERPYYREGLNKTITENLTISHFESKDCWINSYEPSYAMGFVDTKLVEVDNALGLKLMIGPPIDFNWIHDITINCPENNVARQTAKMLLTSEKDPWIEQVFPFGEGEYNIKIDLMDQEIKNFSGAGSASYTARLRLERVVKE